MQDPRAIPPVVKSITGPSEQVRNGPPVVLPNLPRMESTGSVSTVVMHSNQAALAMDTHHAPAPAVSQNVMERWAGAGQAESQGAGRAASGAANPESPQQGKPPAPVAAQGDGYVRVEMHSENGQLSVVGVHEVAGPLALPSAVARGFVYEALVDDQQVALGSLTDVGISRSFANHDVPGPEGKHRIFPKPSFNFFVRIPKTQLTLATLPRLNIVLHQVTEAPDRLVPNVPLAKQSAVQAAEISRLPGLRLETLSPNVRPQMERLIEKQ